MHVFFGINFKICYHFFYFTCPVKAQLMHWHKLMNMVLVFVLISQQLSSMIKIEVSTVDDLLIIIQPFSQSVLKSQYFKNMDISKKNNYIVLSTIVFKISLLYCLPSLFLSLGTFSFSSVAFEYNAAKL